MARQPTLFLALVSLAAAASASCGDHDAPAAEAACQLAPTQTFHERI